MIRYKIKPVTNEINRLSLTPSGSASTRVTGTKTTTDSHPKSGINRITIPIPMIKNVADPDKDLLKNLPKSVILPTIAANESAIVNINTEGTAIFFSKIKKVMVAEMNK